MITQIYTAQTVTEATDLAAIGVDHVGITVSERGLPGEVDIGTGLDIIAALGATPARSVALTVETDLEVIREFIADLRPDIVHLCGDTAIVGPVEVAGLRQWMERTWIDVELMQAIGVSGPESVDLAVSFADIVDWLILDSVSDSVDGIGAAGVTHDWEMSRQIVAAVEVPVILAGGLGPDNVAAAIGKVHPAGVDSLTRTNTPRPDGTFVKDLGAVRRFVAAAGEASASGTT